MGNGSLQRTFLYFPPLLSSQRRNTHPPRATHCPKTLLVMKKSVFLEKSDIQVTKTCLKYQFVPKKIRNRYIDKIPVWVSL